MVARIGIRREDKNEWERRVPLTPIDVGELQREHGVPVSLQPFPRRAYQDGEYLAARMQMDEKLDGCSIILGIKEMPLDFFQEGLTYVFFSHVIKGQPYNMPMLRKLMDLGCNLIDYEKITDDAGIRLVFFGMEAGQAGMIDTLWALGRRLQEEGIESPFLGIKQAIGYRRLTEAEATVKDMGERVAQEGVPDAVHPMIFGFAGYGNVSRGAQGILDLLPTKEISPEELLDPPPDAFDSRNHVYKVVFKEEHMVEPTEGQSFELQDYYDNPERYKGVFPRYVPHLTVLVNCIYWSERYPRLVTKDLIRELYANEAPKLKVIGDISCDVEGAIEVTVKVTDPGNPVFVYDVDKDEAVDGVAGNGPVILAVDNLPCELPRESSARFSSALAPLIPDLAKADFTVDFDKLDLPPPLKRAIIVYHGELTPDFKYIQEFLQDDKTSE